MATCTPDKWMPHNEQVCDGEMGEEKQSGSCTVERRGAEDTKVVRNRLMWVAYAATHDVHVMSGPVLVQRDIYGSMALSPWHMLPLKAMWMLGIWATT